MTSEKRASERVIPMVTDEDMVVVGSGGRHIIAKMMDLSNTGTLVYILLDSDLDAALDGDTVLSLYHQGKVFDVTCTLTRRIGRLAAFRFADESDKSLDLQAKLIRMEVEWNRLKSLV